MPRTQLIPIHPKIAKLIDERKVLREFRGALDHTGNIVRDDFKKTVRTWRNKPTFRKVGPRRIKITVFGVDVFTEHKIYGFVTRGTRAHPIPRRPKIRGRLVFRTGYRAKTRPRIISSKGGGAFGPFVSAKQVQHPGTQARDFDKEIARRRQKNLRNLARLAILRAVRTR